MSVRKKKCIFVRVVLKVVLHWTSQKQKMLKKKSLLLSSNKGMNSHRKAI